MRNAEPPRVQEHASTTARPFETLSVDELDLEVRRSSRRRVLELTIDRGGELVLSAPDHLSAREMRDFVRKKKLWLYTKLAEKSARLNVQRQQVADGEFVLYLGKKHRLVILDDAADAVEFSRGKFHLRRSDFSEARNHFVRWYTERAKVWLTARTEAWAGEMQAFPRAIRVLDLKNRWGSCSPSGDLNFHWNTIRLRPNVIDYVIVHELAHIDEPHHTPAFWRRVGTVLPDYEGRKAWLADNGASAQR